MADENSGVETGTGGISAEAESFSGAGLGETFFQQAEQTQHITRDRAELMVVFFGDYADAKAFADSFSIGDSHPESPEYELYDIELLRSAGPSGRLVLRYADVAANAEQSGQARLRSSFWRLNSVPIDVSVYKYCGVSQVQNANRVRIETWWNNPGGDPAETMEDMLLESDIPIAEKLLQGKDTVQRHYPVAVKSTVYGRGEFVPAGELDHFFSAAELKSEAGAPDSIAGRAAYWLKQQEDIELGRDGSQTLTESWIGGDSFDRNFYGETPDRWEFGSI